MDIEKIISNVRESFRIGAKKVSDSVSKSKAFEKYQDSEDKVADILDDVGSFATGLYDKVAKAGKPLVKKSKAGIYDAIYAEYRKAGMPYGDTHEGFMRWTEEREKKVRSAVDDGLEKGRKTIVGAAKKTSEFVEDRVLKKKPSETTIDGEPSEPSVTIPKEVDLE